MKKEETPQLPKFDPFDWNPDDPFGLDDHGDDDSVDHVDVDPMDNDDNNVRPFKYFCVLFCLCG